MWRRGQGRVALGPIVPSPRLVLAPAQRELVVDLAPDVTEVAEKLSFEPCGCWYKYRRQAFKIKIVVENI